MTNYVPESHFENMDGMTVQMLCDETVLFEPQELHDPAEMFDDISKDDIVAGKRERLQRCLRGALSRAKHLTEVDHIAEAARLLDMMSELGHTVKETDHKIWRRYQHGVGMCCDRRRVWVSDGRGPRGEHPRELEQRGFTIMEDNHA